MTEQTTKKRGRKVVQRPYQLQNDFDGLLHDVSRLRRTVFDKVLWPLGITRAQWWLLVNLTHLDGKGISQSDLADLLQVGKVTIGAMLALLDNNGYIERRDDQADGRIKLIFLTDTGYGVLEQTRQLAIFINRTIMAGVSPEQIAAAEALLLMMKTNLISLDQDLK